MQVLYFRWCMVWVWCLGCIVYSYGRPRVVGVWLCALHCNRVVLVVLLVTSSRGVGCWLVGVACWVLGVALVGLVDWCKLSFADVRLRYIVFLLVCVSSGVCFVVCFGIVFVYFLFGGECCVG